ncbi:oxidoreductase [Streptomyces sp. TLI_171]|uniref:oxidoreductase n=1 Tax=Streptomyces sp. TLI_171 TaxID=1938859 RepID=UPI000C379BCC|nr:oxidoreductase [Streptomyces sp. TLI_171]RKE18162.1 putative dehydrogenase [Streptomyces sp. TLI_171]
MSNGLGTLLVGMGRAGHGLHLPVLRRLRSASDSAHLFAAAPMLAVDPHRRPAAAPDLRPTTLAEAPRLHDPARTVVHLCTPPTERAAALDTLGRLGYRRVLLEKPVAADARGLDELLALRERHRLDLVVVAQWLGSPLTDRLRVALADGALGPLRTIHVVQRKPRFSRSLAGDGHPTAFDIELPHSLGLCLALAGPGEVTAAGSTDMVVGDRVLPRLGTAWLNLQHETGAWTRIRSDLTSPVRERRITLELAHGTLIGHFPGSEADAYARLTVIDQEGEHTELLHDDALGTFLHRTYGYYFAATTPGTAGEPHPELAVNTQVVRLLDRAKTMAAQARDAQARNDRAGGAQARGPRWTVGVR